MDWTLVWKTIGIFVLGTAILRFSGRKSISQMTFPETVLMIALGTLLIQPVTNQGYWTTFGVALILVLTLMTVEFLQLKFDGVESFVSGKSKIVIQDGKLQENALKTLRLPVDKLEARLRQAGISSISDVDYATIEPSGQLGYQLKNEKQPATKEDIQQLIQLIQNGQLTAKQDSSNNIFSEINSPNSDQQERLQ